MESVADSEEPSSGHTSPDVADLPILEVLSSFDDVCTGLPAPKAIALTLDQTWFWVATSVTVEHSAEDDGEKDQSGARKRASMPRMSLRMRFEPCEAFRDQHLGLIVELHGSGDEIDYARVLLFGCATDPYIGQASVRFSIFDAPPADALAPVAALVREAEAQLPGPFRRGAERLIAQRLVDDALQPLPENVCELLQGLRSVAAVIVVATEDRGLMQAAVDAAAKRLGLKIKKKPELADEPDDECDVEIATPSAGACKIDADALSKAEAADVVNRVLRSLAENISVVVTCTSPGKLPPGLRRNVDALLAIPRFDRELFGSCFIDAFGAPPSVALGAADDAWIKVVSLDDFRAALRTASTPDAALTRIRAVASRRARPASTFNTTPLSGLHGLGQAKEWAIVTIKEMRLAAAGKLSWADVDRGALLVGPPGTGKTALARAIAAESGLPLLSVSAAAWQATGYLNDLLKAMRSDFADARRQAPCFVFVDEIDAIGNRERFSGHSRQYCVEVVNALLAELDGFERRDGVVVLAATNYVADVDPALIRPGRLDRIVRIPLPDKAALGEIYREYLGTAIGPDVDVGELAGLSAGRSGAVCEFVVRCAKRRARTRGADVVNMADLRTELVELMLGPKGEQPETDHARRTAVHEAGHAISRLLGPDRGQTIAYVSIQPRRESSGVAVELPPDSAPPKREDMLARIRMNLGGRAAEEVVYGQDDVSLGAGGGSASDLATATTLAVLMETVFGLGSEHPLVWFGPPIDSGSAAAALRADRRLAKRVGALIDREYRNAVELVRANRDLLDSIVELLLEQREVDGKALRALLEVHRSLGRHKPPS